MVLSISGEFCRSSVARCMSSCTSMGALVFENFLVGVDFIFSVIFCSHVRLSVAASYPLNLIPDLAKVLKQLFAIGFF